MCIMHCYYFNAWVCQSYTFSICSSMSPSEQLALQYHRILKTSPFCNHGNCGSKQQLLLVLCSLHCYTIASPLIGYYSWIRSIHGLLTCLFDDPYRKINLSK